MSEFEKSAANQPGGAFLRDCWDLLRHNKKWWLGPLIAVLLSIAALLTLASGAAAPFIYTLF